MHVAQGTFLHRAWRKMEGKRRDWPTMYTHGILMALVPCVALLTEAQHLRDGASMTSRNRAAGARAMVPLGPSGLMGLTDR